MKNKIGVDKEGLINFLNNKTKYKNKEYFIKLLDIINEEF